jgi:energy-coupling factor transporter ATP-binding protein EcfA2
MLHQHTMEQLRTLKLTGMLDALEQQLVQPQTHDLCFDERLALLARLLKAARLRVQACVEDIDYRHPRGLEKSRMAALAGCDWIRQSHNLCITGSTGCGKTWLACALGKLCRRLQVPKPPRGYWARVASGKTPRKPPLQANRTEVEERLRKQVKSKSQVTLSKLQLEFLRYALDELVGSGVDAKACELAYDGIRSISAELAARILIVLQTRYEKWLADRTTASGMNGAFSSLSNLVGKLLPHAKEQLLIFRRKTDGRYSRADSPTISVRATPDFLERIALSSLTPVNNDF